MQVSFIKFLSKSSFLLGLKLLTAVLSLLFYFLLAKQLPANQFGLFSLAMSFLLFSTVLATQGLEQVTVRFIAKNKKEHSGNLYWSILFYSFISSCLAALMVYLFLPLFSSEIINQILPEKIASLIAILTILQTILLINSSALKGRQHATSSLVLTGFITFTIVLFLLFIFPIRSATQALAYFTYSATLAAIVSFILVTIKFGSDLKVNKQQAVSEVKKELSEISIVSRRLFVISLAALITQQLSTLIVARYVSLEALAIFSLALKLSLLLSYPLIVVNTMTAAKYAKLYQKQKLIEFKHLALSVTKGLIVIATIGVLVIFIGIEYVLTYFGQNYIEAAIIVKVLVIGQWFNLATGSVVSMLIMSGYEKLHRKNALILTSINIIALLVFIPDFGLMAAAIITSVIMALKNLVALYYVNKLIYSKAGSNH